MSILTISASFSSTRAHTPSLALSLSIAPLSRFHKQILFLVLSYHNYLGISPHRHAAGPGFVSSFAPHSLTHSVYANSTGPVLSYGAKLGYSDCGRNLGLLPRRCDNVRS